jgi:hypothetical protein
MLRRTLLKRQGHGGFPNWPAGGGKAGAQGGAGGNPFSSLMQQGAGGRPNAGGFGLDPEAMKQMQNQMRAMMSNPQMQEQMRNAISNPGMGGEGGKIGVMAFGHGVNEKGKRVVRGAKLEIDPKTGKISKDFAEKQLDPDDPMLPKETVEDYNTDGAIEVEVDLKHVEGKSDAHHSEGDAAAASSSKHREAPEVLEAEFIEVMPESKDEKKP